ncbi:MAG: tRNA pseudouridine(38-40) synthase TruA [Propionibacteriaceae bacterium]|jgi:tRNA pseudouridine38-40 synthase|nr:tRNA pseudouridine(38-40) synthase TruA [Propionibacteriaceae bacterium]
MSQPIIGPGPGRDAAVGQTAPPPTGPAHSDPADQTTLRLRLDLAYDGTDFAGWAKQPGRRTVQGQLEAGLAQVLRLDRAVSVTCAGRTDAGVHALGQVCHVDLPATVVRHGRVLAVADHLAAWLGRALPDDIVLRALSAVPAAFDARFSALWRRYVYRLWDDPAAVDPRRRRWVALVHRPLDCAAMAQAGPALLGLHDFTALSRARPGATAIRRLTQLDLVRHPDGLIELTVQADAFCHSMVRSLAGALTAVGQGRRDARWLADLLDRPQRANEVQVMPACGLTLEEVGYPPPSELASRAAQTRRVRRWEGGGH